MNLSTVIKYSGISCFSPNGNYLILTRNSTLLLYETTQLEIINKFSFNSNITKCEFSPDSSLIFIFLSKLNQFEVKSLDSPDWQCKITENIFGLSNVLWSPDSRKILTITNYNIKMSIWSLTDSSQPIDISYPKFDNKAISFSSDGSFLALAERKETKDSIGIYYIYNFTLLSHFNVSTVDLQDLQWSKDNTYIIIWDSIATCKLFIYSIIGSLLMVNEGYNNVIGIKGVILSPNGHYITVGYSDGSIRMFNHITFKLMRTIVLGEKIDEKIKKDKVSILKEDEGKFCEVQYSNKIFKDIKKEKGEDNKGGNEEGILSMEYSYDSQYLAIKMDSDMDNVLWIFEIASLRLNAIIIFTKVIKDFKWSPIEQKLLIGTDNSNLYIYIVNSILIVNLPNSALQVKEIKWNKDGRIFSISDSKKLLIGYSEIEM